MSMEVSTKHILEAVVESILTSGSELVIDGSFYQEVADFVDPHSLDAKGPEELIAEYAPTIGYRLLDFGCGTGAYQNFLESLGFNWTGLNYASGMEAGAAKTSLQKQNDKMFFYDGLEIPFDNESFDVVYSFQVFEHIQDVKQTFREIKRVLRPGGRLIGAVSYLEQIHDFSTFNFTPYGFKMAATAAELRIHRLYPRSDVFSFLFHRLLVATTASDETSLLRSFLANNNISQMIGKYGSSKKDVKNGNLLRLMFSSHFTFDAYR